MITPPAYTRAGGVFYVPTESTVGLYVAGIWLRFGDWPLDRKWIFGVLFGIWYDVGRLRDGSKKIGIALSFAE